MQKADVVAVRASHGLVDVDFAIGVSDVTRSQLQFGLDLIHGSLHLKLTPLWTNRPP